MNGDLSIPPPDTDVLIVGAGPTGLILASELLSRGVRCRIVDRLTEFPTTTRAHGVQPRTLEGFDRMGIVDTMLAEGSTEARIQIYAHGKLLVDLDLHAAPRPDAPYLSALITRQPNVERVLRAHVAALGGVIETGSELVDLREDASGIVATVADATTGQTRVVRAAYLAGCDGGHSQVRKLLGLGFEGETSDVHYVLGDLEIAWEQPPATVMWLHEDGWLGGGVFAGSPVWNLAADVQPDASGVVEPASAALFERLIRERAGIADAKVTRTSWLSNYTVSRRLVDHYRRGRAFVAGDAAHVHSPAGGQGMNTGIQDAFNLGWKLALVLQGKASPTLLDTYEEERRPVAQALLRNTNTLGSVMYSPSPALGLLRDHVLLPLLRRPAIRQALLYRLAQLNVAYRESSLSRVPPADDEITGRVAERLRFRGAHRPGDRAPDAPAHDARTGEATSLFDVFRGPHFTLLLFTGPLPAPDGQVRLVALARQVKERLGADVRPCLVVSAAALPTSPDGVGDVLLDPAGEAHRIYGARSEAVYLIRPDGYVGFRAALPAWEPLRAYLARIFLPTPSRVPSADAEGLAADHQAPGVRPTSKPAAAEHPALDQTPSV